MQANGVANRDNPSIGDTASRARPLLRGSISLNLTALG